MQLGIEGRTALVFGAGGGLGGAIASALAAEGAKVVAADINAEAAAKTADAIRDSGGTALPLEWDLADLDAIDGKVSHIEAELGGIDILVNNAGITRDNLLLKMTEADWDAVLDINLKGTFLCTKAAIKPMIKQRSGKIINIASVIGIMGNAGQANYAASKGGIISFTKTMARELGKRNIRVNAIAPGFIASKMTEVLSEEARNNLLEQIPLGSLGQPEYVAQAVLFLASPEASYITGHVLNVDGGMAM